MPAYHVDYTTGCISAKYCPIINHTSVERLFIQLSDVYKSKFRQMYTYDWFCGPGSHILFSKKNIYIFNINIYIYNLII